MGSQVRKHLAALFAPFSSDETPSIAKIGSAQTHGKLKHNGAFFLCSLRVKPDVMLPEGSGWEWDGEWAYDTAGADSEGWQYAFNFVRTPMQRCANNKSNGAVVGAIFFWKSIVCQDSLGTSMNVRKAQQNSAKTFPQDAW